MMTFKSNRSSLRVLFFFFALSSFYSTQAYSNQMNSGEITARNAETQIRHLLEPLLDKYCSDDCKLMGIKVNLDNSDPESMTPGFDDLEPRKQAEFTPASGRVKLLIDDRLGPVSRGKLLDLVQQYLDTLDYPVKVDTQVTHFPRPPGTEAKIFAIREKIEKSFLTTTNDLLQQFCPRQCLLTDFNLQTEVVNSEEVQFGNSAEFIQDGDTAIKIKTISATILMDQTLTPEEQGNLLEMIRMKNNLFKNININGKSLKFPRPMLTGSIEGGGGSLEKSASGYKTENNSFGREERSLASTSKSSKESNNLIRSNNLVKSNNLLQSSNSNSETETKSENKSENASKAESNTKQERFEKFERIERVENGDAVQAELQKFKIFGLIFACSALALLIFIALANLRIPQISTPPTVQRIIQTLTSDPVSSVPSSAQRTAEPSQPRESNSLQYSKRFEIERLYEELLSVYSQQPKVAKQVFSKILTEEGVETTAQYISIFGESIIIEMLRDPSLQSDVSELLEFYSKNPIDLQEDVKLDLLKRLHNRTVTGKLIVLGSRSSTLFDFLSEMDGTQTLELIRTESLTVKSIILTQCDPQKRATIYAQMDQDVRMKLLTELSRIDYLPKDYIYNVATALKRKKRENPRLNTEALPGSDVLVSLLERTGLGMQKTVVSNLETNNPDSARTVKSKLVSIDTLKFLRDAQLLEVVLSLKHDELVQFLKGAPQGVKQAIFSKSPADLVIELEEEIEQITTVSREAYQAVERKILNRMKVMATEGQINLIETNERMFSDPAMNGDFIQSSAVQSAGGQSEARKGVA